MISAKKDTYLRLVHSGWLTVDLSSLHSTVHGFVKLRTLPNTYPIYCLSYEIMFTMLRFMMHTVLVALTADNVGVGRLT